MIATTELAWYKIQPQSVKKPLGPAPIKYPTEPIRQLIYDKIIYHRPPWFSFSVPIVLVYVVWFATTIYYDLWHLFKHGWTMMLTMVLGAFVAGSTTLGGGAIAFPVMTLVLHTQSSTARDFSLMIQSIGMTSALWGIFYQRILVDMTSFIYCGIGGTIGVLFGLRYVAPYIPSDYTTMFFVSFWLSFAIALFLVNRHKSREVLKSIKQFDSIRVRICLICVGILGGIVTSMTGSGLDIVSFSALTLLFSMSEDCATPTTVSLMGVNTVIGTIAKGMMYGLEPEAKQLVWFAFPIVVIMAPTGSYVASFLHRKMLASWVYVLCLIQFITAYIVLDLTPFLMFFSLFSLVCGSIMWFGLVQFSSKLRPIPLPSLVLDPIVVTETTDGTLDTVTVHNDDVLVGYSNVPSGSPTVERSRVAIDVDEATDGIQPIAFLREHEPSASANK